MRLPLNNGQAYAPTWGIRVYAVSLEIGAGIESLRALVSPLPRGSKGYCAEWGECACGQGRAGGLVGDAGS